MRTFDSEGKTGMFGLVALFEPYAVTGWSLLPPSVTRHFIGLPIAQVDGVEAPASAEGTPGSTGNPNPMGSLLDMLPLVIFLYVIFYVLMIRPQRKQQQQHDLLLKNTETVRHGAHQRRHLRSGRHHR